MLNKTLIFSFFLIFHAYIILSDETDDESWKQISNPEPSDDDSETEDGWNSIPDTSKKRETPLSNYFEILKLKKKGVTYAHNLIRKPGMEIYYDLIESMNDDQYNSLSEEYERIKEYINKNPNSSTYMKELLVFEKLEFKKKDFNDKLEKQYKRMTLITKDVHFSKDLPSLRTVITMNSRLEKMKMASRLYNKGYRQNSNKEKYTGLPRGSIKEDDYQYNKASHMTRTVKEKPSMANDGELALIIANNLLSEATERVINFDDEYDKRYSFFYKKTKQLDELKEKRLEFIQRNKNISLSDLHDYDNMFQVRLMRLELGFEKLMEYMVDNSVLGKKRKDKYIMKCLVKCKYVQSISRNNMELINSRNSLSSMPIKRNYKLSDAKKIALDSRIKNNANKLEIRKKNSMLNFRKNINSRRMKNIFITSALGSSIAYMGTVLFSNGQNNVEIAY